MPSLAPAVRTIFSGLLGIPPSRFEINSATSRRTCIEREAQADNSSWEIYVQVRVLTTSRPVLSVYDPTLSPRHDSSILLARSLTSDAKSGLAKSCGLKQMHNTYQTELALDKINYSISKFEQWNHTSKKNCNHHSTESFLTWRINVIGTCPIAWQSPILARMTSVKGNGLSIFCKTLDKKSYHLLWIHYFLFVFSPFIPSLTWLRSLQREWQAVHGRHTPWVWCGDSWCPWSASSSTCHSSASNSPRRRRSRYALQPSWCQEPVLKKQ